VRSLHYFVLRWSTWEKLPLPRMVTTHPLRTFPRARASKNITDFWNYWFQREYRVWGLQNYSNAATQYFTNITWKLFLFVLVLRTACILFQLGPLLESLCRSVGLGYKIDVHQRWFLHSYRRVDTTPILHKGAWAFWHWLRAVVMSLGDVGKLRETLTDAHLIIPLTICFLAVEASSGTFLARWALFQPRFTKQAAVAVCVFCLTFKWWQGHFLIVAFLLWISWRAYCKMYEYLDNYLSESFEKDWKSKQQDFFGACAGLRSCQCASIAPATASADKAYRPDHRLSSKVVNWFAYGKSEPCLRRTLS